MKRTVLALAALTIAAVAHAAEGDPLTPDQMPILAAARIFALDNRLHGDLGVADAEEAHIGERFEVNRAVLEETDTTKKVDPCAFTMRHRDGPIVQRIDFSRLAGEMQIIPEGMYARVRIRGQRGAVCEVANGRETNCTSGLEMLLMRDGNPSELVYMQRAMRYIAEACPMLRELP